MTLLYGVVSTSANASELMSPLDSAVASRWRARPTRICTENSFVCVSATVPDGCYGHAEAAHFEIFLSGFVQAPLPDWPHPENPVESPSLVAEHLLKRYVAMGHRFLEGVIGQYIAIIVDRTAPRVLLAADSAGFRKAFYTQNQEVVYFSTSLYLLSAAFPQGAIPNRDLEDFYLGYEIVPEPETIYNDVRKVHRSRVFIDGNTLSPLPYCASTINRPSRRLDGEQQVINGLYEIFMETLSSLLPQATRVGVALGGFDSALVASALYRLGKSVETYSFSFDRQDLNQPNIDILCRSIPVKHHWIPITANVIREGLTNYALWFNQISSQPHYPIQFAHVISNMQEQGITHAFTGDGCDELFLGYPIVHRRAVIFSRIGLIPAPIRKILLRLLSSSSLEQRLGEPVRILRNIITILGRHEPTRGHITNRVFDDITLSRIRQGPPPSQRRPSEAVLEDLATGTEKLSALRRAYHGKSIPGLNATRNEGAVSRFGVTVQSPYTHPLMKEFAQTLPEELFRPKTKTKSRATGKYILMKMAEAHKLLPKQLIYQPKASPVTSLVDYWIMDDLRSTIEDQVKYLPFDYDAEWLRHLYTPKLAEDIFRSRTLGHFSFKAICLLCTYAAYFADVESATGAIRDELSKGFVAEREGI